MYSATAGANTLDEYIEKLKKLRDRHGGKCPVITDGGDYPEGACSPRYVTKDQANGYTPEGSIVLS